jgi:hypothetical protein
MRAQLARDERASLKRLKELSTVVPAQRHARPPGQLGKKQKARTQETWHRTIDGGWVRL